MARGGVGCRAVGGEREGQEAVQTSVGLTSTAVGAFVLPPDRVPAGGAPDENWRAGRVAEGWQRGGRGGLPLDDLSGTVQIFQTTLPEHIEHYP